MTVFDHGTIVVICSWVLRKHEETHSIFVHGKVMVFDFFPFQVMPDDQLMHVPCDERNKMKHARGFRHPMNTEAG
jgi:hypothetical protein